MAFEIVNCAGERKRCTATENPELFRAIPWSHGTLGFLVGVEIRIVPSKPWVKLTYEPFHCKADAISACDAAFKTDVDLYVYSPNYIYSLYDDLPSTTSWQCAMC